MHLRKLSGFALAAALACTLSTPFALSQSGDSGGKQDMKDAGHETKDAAKDAGHGIKQGTKKGYHKTKHATKKVGHKIEDKPDNQINNPSH